MFIEIPTKPGELRRTTSMKHAVITHEQRFSIMGEALLFQSNDARLVEIAAEAFGRFPVAPETSAPLVVQLFVREGKQQMSSAPGAVHPPLVCHTMGHLFYLNVGAENTIVVDLQQGYAFGYLSSQMLQDPAFVRHTFVEAAALSMLGMARAFVPIHAACVVKNGRSLLLQAQAGTGKTTLAFACLRRGYQVLAEDVVHVKVKPDGLRLWGMPWKFHLLADTLRFFPELRNRPQQMQVNGEWKIEVELTGLFPHAAVTNAAPGVIILLERAASGQHTTFEPISHREAEEQFEVVWSWASGWQPHYDQQLRPLLQQGVYRLAMNGTPDEAVDALDEILSL